MEKAFPRSSRGLDSQSVRGEHAILAYGFATANFAASHSGRLIDAIVELLAESSEIFTTSPVRGA